MNRTDKEFNKKMDKMDKKFKDVFIEFMEENKVLILEKIWVEYIKNLKIEADELINNFVNYSIQQITHSEFNDINKEIKEKVRFYIKNIIDEEQLVSRDKVISKIKELI